MKCVGVEAIAAWEDLYRWEWIIHVGQDFTKAKYEYFPLAAGMVEFSI